MSDAQIPLILTSGDPSGVGPELTIQAWKAIGASHPFVVLGDVEQLQSLAKSANIPATEIADPNWHDPNALSIIPQNFAQPPQPGVAQPQNAPATVAMIERAVGFVKAGAASAIVTNPIHKRVLIEGADFPHPGHTEFLTALDGKKHAAMLLASPELRVVPATIHIPLQDVASAVTPQLLSQTIQLLDSALKLDFGIARPRIAVAGLNPHAGEGGQIGTEETDFIEATLDRLRDQGYDIKGPMSADTMFHPRAREAYDAAVCMYHDQALIPIKTIDFDRGVNVTLGLSFIRTSPDHGTAYDIAGQNVANPSSLIEAIKLASHMAANRARS